MTTTITTIDAARPNFAKLMTDLDLRQPLHPKNVAKIETEMNRYSVLMFRGQNLNDDQQIAFTRNFGPLEKTYFVPKNNVQTERVPSEINDISNLDRNNKILPRDDRQRLFQLNNLLWHSNSSYKMIPAKFSLLSARIIPNRENDTQFADMRTTWNTLNAKTQTLIHDMICEHSHLFSRSELGYTFTKNERHQFAPMQQRLVQRHPATDRLSLFLSSHDNAIVGWPLPEKRALLRELTKHTTQRERVYTHK